MGDSPAHGKRYFAVRMKSFIRASRRHAMRLALPSGSWTERDFARFISSVGMPGRIKNDPRQ
ncbi:hypothetical protein CNE_1c09090 [Cupriavidus necator N-1]|jgi:hypothetical protein|uniref:Uncharacterized protein n=1 Tax=Cupriavidus necator (strain ATCC 43291 / DSM 13513 / CCUG 52238 / LMG 8453 / N-1) TaxID=1042878 RepID=G0EZ04_CUPNN|nr:MULTISPECIES: hypothetical protein [Cupriavidus]AEI76269.1 hypothetical protein CNE_1c09090 [Cupriavidus necator N-1]KAI3609970.1 hypothetical protein D8I24_0640 [Cupriavidus necator H850]MDX6011607.1 hypothetical protein [Cupriavidus necator]QUN29270.1 hypothetical protein KB879_04740 [Cupriavidus sp. KK10]